MADFAGTRRAATLPTMRIAKGLAAFRIFVGLVWLGNALAKVVNQGSYDLGVVSFSLISRDTARGLLESYTGPESNAIAPLKSLYIAPLAILAAVPAGRVWGQDGRLAARFGDRWPF